MWVIKASSKPEGALFWAEALESFCLAVSFYEDPDERSWTLEGLCEQEPDLPLIQAMLDKAGSLENPAPLLKAAPLPERNWLEENKRSFPPLQIGNFYLYGSHHEAAPPENSFPLLIDAATAFGSGHHATTAGCLLLLQEQIISHPWKSPLDLGCGSGILALALACLNPQVPVLALDNDPEAVAVTSKNTALNHKSAHVTVALSEGLEGLSSSQSFDLIVANILAQPLVELAPAMNRFVSPKGHVILSGFLDTQWKEVENAYKEQGFEPVRHILQDQWVSLCLEKVH